MQALCYHCSLPVSLVVEVAMRSKNHDSWQNDLIPALLLLLAVVLILVAPV